MVRAVGLLGRRKAGSSFIAPDEKPLAKEEFAQFSEHGSIQRAL
jgi:hypothetical protein